MESYSIAPLLSLSSDDLYKLRHINFFDMIILTKREIIHLNSIQTFFLFIQDQILGMQT
ncbi:hypothetical protein CLOBOL_06786 [Enterocloster bolteae ATCC BAA-613]|uniref:Uncharacterized protein n=1 Tax=Enterocloster bolteae (strain ATCC BAA-613 / DSM 15670 / CCUG 46953 / JCM 12243 / WAL 16351) TaxID=411902 RepID=A8S411_ENTBW|nr:hypothetical protein CLOBOL_06786 [Enterocloster bolteae ATCC BAA-613]